MSWLLETDMREQKEYEKRIQTFVGNTVNDLHYEIKFENHVKDKNNSSIMRNISFLFVNKNIFYSWRCIFLTLLRIQLP